MRKNLAPPLIALASAACLLAAGCANGDDTVDDPVGTTVAPTDDDPGETSPTVVEPQDDLVDPVPQAWETHTLLDDDRVLVTFWSGTPECFGADVDVIETETDVTINVVTGLKPEAVDAACIMIAIETGLEIQLDAPLGDREVRQDA